MQTQGLRSRALIQAGGYKLLHGERRLSVTAAALTTIAAATGTAGHVFSFRNPDTTKSVLLRYLAIDFNLTTAFGAAQAMGFDVVLATGYTAAHTGGTAVDVGSTVANSQKTRALDATSCITANNVRVGGAGALTAGTHTLHANAMNSCQKWMAAVGAQIQATFLDARDDGDGALRSPWVLAQDEGFVIRNTILMGAAGVGSLIVTMEWDEVTL